VTSEITVPATTRVLTAFATPIMCLSSPMMVY